MKITEEQLKEMEGRIALASRKPVPAPPAKVAKPRGMNKTEAAYAQILQARLLAGEIRKWDYERVTLRLGFDLRYTPDFRVVLADGTVQFHETKGGFFRDDAKVKLRTAASAFPEWQFFLVVRIKTEWTISPVQTIP